MDLSSGDSRRPGLFSLFQAHQGDVKVSSERVAALAADVSVDLADADRARLREWADELSFWEEYARIYVNLEKAQPYSNLRRAFRQLIRPKPQQVWLDAGCGPARMALEVWEASGRSLDAIVGVDVVLQPAERTIAQQEVPLPLELKCAHLGEKLPFPDQYFDGIIANLILPYVMDFEGSRGKNALRRVLEEMHRLLKPAGRLVWSTPIHGVRFEWVFLASLPDMLNIFRYFIDKDFSRIAQGARILKHALCIQRKGRSGAYTFLGRHELEALLGEIGLLPQEWRRTFAQQAWVISTQKI